MVCTQIAHYTSEYSQTRRSTKHTATQAFPKDLCWGLSRTQYTHQTHPLHTLYADCVNCDVNAHARLNSGLRRREIKSTPTTLTIFFPRSMKRFIVNPGHEADMKNIWKIMTRLTRVSCIETWQDPTFSLAAIILSISVP